MNKQAPIKPRAVGPLNFDGAALINPDGSETPITKEMIKKVCDELISAAQQDNETRH